MTERDDIELLLAKIEMMRGHQRNFFARRMPADKKLSIHKEKEVDELCKLMRRKGYDPEKFKTSTEQKNMF